MFGLYDFKTWFITNAREIEIALFNHIFLLTGLRSIRANTKPKARRYVRPKGGHYEGRGLGFACIDTQASY